MRRTDRSFVSSKRVAAAVKVGRMARVEETTGEAVALMVEEVMVRAVVLAEAAGATETADQMVMAPIVSEVEGRVAAMVVEVEVRKTNSVELAATSSEMTLNAANGGRVREDEFTKPSIIYFRVSSKGRIRLNLIQTHVHPKERCEYRKYRAKAFSVYDLGVFEGKKGERFVSHTASWRHCCTSASPRLGAHRSTATGSA